MHSGGDATVIKAGNREGEEKGGVGGGGVQSCLIVAFQRTGD